MGTDRRKFLRISAAAGGAVALGKWPVSATTSSYPGAAGRLLRPARPPHPDPGRHRVHRAIPVRYAVARGHDVTVFNRGRRQADLPASVKHLVGDRTRTTWRP